MSADHPQIILMESSIRDDCYYRILVGERVKYLTVKINTLSARELDDMPLDFMDILPTIPYQQNDWNVAQISRDSDEGPVTTSLSQVALPGVNSIWHPRRISFLELDRVEQLALLAQECMWKVDALSDSPETMIAKMARFGWEIPYIEKETKVYQMLEGTRLGPRFLGHIHEEGRVMGILLEKVQGRHAGIEDLEVCRAALGRLHDLGILHGDCNRHNFIVGYDNKVTIVDFEGCTFAADVTALKEEMDSLEGQLREETGRGGGGFVECEEGELDD